MSERSFGEQDDNESIEYGLDDDLRSECSSTKAEEDFKKSKLHDLREFKKPTKIKLVPKSTVSDEHSREERRKERFHVLTLDAYSRHKKFINDYFLYYGGSHSEFKRDASKDKTDFDVLRENHRFLWDDDDDDTDSWEKRLAKKYYDKLFKEYCIADLTFYKKNKIALRWRIEKEVISGKGQFECGNKGCQEADGLRSWEVNFAYVEQGQKKNALVKLRLCPDCSDKLNYHHKKREIRKKKKRKHLNEENDEDDEDDGGDGSDAKRSKLHGDDNDTDDKDADSSSNDDGKSKTSTSNISDESDNIWLQDRIIEKDKTKEEEFDEYFEDIFL